LEYDLVEDKSTFKIVDYNSASRNGEPFEKMIAKRDLRISTALVETILKNLTGRKRHIHALSILVENEETIYDVTVDRQDFVTTLENNLPIYEENELYEGCAEIVKAIKFLKTKDLLGGVKESKKKSKK
jgi:hypothetical protein